MAPRRHPARARQLGRSARHTRRRRRRHQLHDRGWTRYRHSTARRRRIRARGARIAVTRVLVAASSAVTRAGLEAILAREPAFTVVGGGGVATIGEDVSEYDPDVVLVELAGSDDDMLTLLHALAIDTDDGTHAAPALVLLTDDRDPVHAVEALRAGVRSLLARDAGAAEIVAAVAAVAAGLVAMAHEWADVLRSTLGVERAA